MSDQLHQYFIGVDIGGTQLRAALYPEDGIEPIQRLVVPTQSPDGKGSALDRLLELIAAVFPEDGKVVRIGVGVAGPINPSTGIVYRCPNITGWECLPLAKIISERFDVPAVLGNDANLAALAEWKYGAGVGHHDLVYLTISTGIGGGVISGDRLLVGGRGIATEVGHMTIMPDGPLCGCGQRGHLEAISSGTAIANYVQEQLSIGRTSMLSCYSGPITAKVVAEYARKGDLLANEAYDRAGTYLGIGIVNFLHLFDPTIVVLGGGVTRTGDLLLQPVWRTLRSHVMSPEYLQGLELTTVKLGDQAGLVGALVLARSFGDHSAA